MASPARRASSPAQRNVTIEDVARAAGVGKSTVSNVLNGSGRVGDAARARVLAMVEQLGYQPHQGARSMRSRRTMRLAYLMPPIQLEPTNLIMMQFLQSLLTAGAQQHYRMLVVAQEAEADPSDDIRRLAADRSVDAFVLSELRPGDRRVDLLYELGMPFACFGRTGPAQPAATPGPLMSATSPMPTGTATARPDSGQGWPPAASPVTAPGCSASRITPEPGRRSGRSSLRPRPTRSSLAATRSP